MIDLNGMSRSALETAKARERKGQLKSDTMSILKHCAEEVVEATEAYSLRKHLDDLNDKSVDFEYVKSCAEINFADELADIITCALIAAANEDIDIEFALKRVQKKNEGRVVEVEK